MRPDTILSLYTTLYPENQPQRRSELIQAIRFNCQCSAISRIVLLMEGELYPELLHESKIEVVQMHQRPNYSDFFSCINARSTGSEISIIANADIYFDQNIDVLDHLPLDDCALALSRWNLRSTGKPELFNRNDSQDVWVFKGPLKPICGNFPLGIPFCDNRFLYELQQAGYRVLNPAFSIQSFHLHAGARGEYTKETVKQYVEGPYRYLYPHNFYSLPQTLWFNATHKVKLQPYRYDPKKINRWWPIRMVRFLGKLCNIPFPLIGYRHTPL